MSNDDPKTWFVIRNGDEVGVDVTDTRTKHYVFFNGRWRHVPHFVKRLCDRYGSHIFGTIRNQHCLRRRLLDGEHIR